jgi:hypothetical protein
MPVVQAERGKLKLGSTVLPTLDRRQGHAARQAVCVEGRGEGRILEVIDFSSSQAYNPAAVVP